MTKQMIVLLTVLLGATDGTVRAQERSRLTGADLLHQAVENENDTEVDFRIESNLAGDTVSAHDVRHGLHRFYEEDIVSAFFKEHTTIALVMAVSIPLGLTILLRRGSFKLFSQPTDSSVG